MANEPIIPDIFFMCYEKKVPTIIICFFEVLVGKGKVSSILSSGVLRININPVHLEIAAFRIVNTSKQGTYNF